MAKLAFLSLFVASFLASFTAASETSPRPLRQTELLALVAGNALPENIVNEIRSRGVAFRMDDSFRGQLTTAGATPSILAALDAAKAPAKVPAEDKPDPALLQHIAAAGKLMKDKHFDEAADELTATLKGNFEKFEIGFVMGELLRRQDRCAEATAVYAEVLRQNPDFPEAHTKLSFVLYCSGDGEDALREAKAALLLAPRNAEAHKNAGLALHLLGKPDAALAEYQEALRIKPDYDAVRYDIALVLYSKRDLDGAIAEYKKAIALNPDLVDARYNLAIILNEQGQLDAALQQYREAKRRAPGRFDIRMNLGNVLFAKGMYPEAMSEYRELTAMYPDTTMALNALAATLYATRDFQGAEKEYRKAAAVDPTDPKSFLGLGLVYEYQNKPNLGAALEQYRRAKELDANSAEASRDVGRVLLSQRKVSEALKELQEAVTLGPSSADTHDLYAQALMLSGDANAAITEFKESLGLDPKQVSVMLELAAALEKKGDWAAALNEYHQAAIAADIAAAPRQPGVGYRTYDAAHQYKEAQERFNQQLAALRKAGKSAEAARLETSIQNQQSAANAAQTLDSLMLSASQAFDERRFDDSERDYKKALAIAEKLQRHDIRTVTALNRLGQLAVFRHDSPGAEVLFERQLKAAEEVYGPNSGAMAESLKFLAMNAMTTKDFAAAEKFLNRDLEVNKKLYGESSAPYMEVLRIFGAMYVYAEAFEKAEPYLIKATDLEASLYHYDQGYGGLEYVNLLSLCSLYDRWGKPDRLEACECRLIPIVEKIPGPDTHLLELLLGQRAKALRTLGRAEEAAQAEQRLKALQPSAAVNPN